MNQNRLILHIDDDPAILRVVGEQLRRQGYQVKSHHDPISAVEQIQETNARLVLLDIDMPELDGLTLLQDIKRHDGGIQVIMLSGLVSLDTAMRSMRMGAEACLFKPVTDAQPLFNVIDSAFEKIDRWWISMNELSQMKSHERELSTSGR